MRHAFGLGRISHKPSANILSQELYVIGPAIEEYYHSRHITTLHFTINKCSKYNVSISSNFCASVRQAVCGGHSEIVDILISAGVDVNYIYNEDTALRAAIHKRNLRFILKLINANAIPTTQRKTIVTIIPPEIAPRITKSLETR